MTVIACGFDGMSIVLIETGAEFGEWKDGIKASEMQATRCRNYEKRFFL